jgi:cysteinyl-tRNA synthetase
VGYDHIYSLLDIDGKALVKLVDKQELIKARDIKRAREAEKQAKKAQAAALQEQKRLERLEKGKVAPEQMFLNLTNDFSKFDENGIPTHDKQGEEIAKSRRKKLQKEWDSQKKLHLEYQKSIQNE